MEKVGVNFKRSGGNFEKKKISEKLKFLMLKKVENEFKILYQKSGKILGGGIFPDIVAGHSHRSCIFK